jgi:asparagine synthase (glutamine-hydrolysing)
MYAGSEINPNYRSSYASRIKYTAGNQLPIIRKWYHQLTGASVDFLNKDFSKQYKQEFNPQTIFSSLNERLYHSTFKHGLQELLRYADRNSMAHSREVRLPFLFHELVEFLFTLPPHMKINHGWTKWIMRQAFAKELPPEICWRTDKIGYEPPQQGWMQNESIQSKITEAKQKLMDNKILSKQHHTKLLQSSKANEINNWKLWMAGEMF